MKTTVVISDPLLARVKRHARRTGRSLRAVIEEGLRLVLRNEAAAPTYTLEDRAVGDPDAPDPLEALSWQELRDEMYGGR